MVQRAMPSAAHHSEISALCSRDLADSARQQIDKEIEDLYGSVRRLKSRRNMFAPVSRLPPEMLYKIFTSFADIEQTGPQAEYMLVYRSTEYSNGSNISWIKISHICRYWRAVALECPRLWSSIIFTRPNWTAEMLKRSKAAPLVVKADLMYMTPKMVDAVQLALQHVSRMKELHLAASKTLMQNLVNNLLISTPYLQSLCLMNARGSPYLLDGDDLYTLPDSLFDGNAPALRQLKLTKCLLSWDSPLLCGLTQLQIHQVNLVARPTIRQLLAALSRMPSLETLDLADALPCVPHGVDSIHIQESPVALPRLSNLCLSGCVLDCASLLHHITFPATCQLVSRATSSTGGDFTSLISAMSLTRNGKQGNEVIRSVKIESSVHEGVRFRGCTATVGAYDFGANPVHIDLTLIWYGGGGRVERVVKDVCSGLPLTQLRVLIIEDIVMQDKSWAEAFGGLAKLHTIRVRGRPLQELVRALDVTHAGARQCNKVKGFPSGDVLFPRLHKLVMDETKFRISFGDGTLDDLMDMLMGRSERRVEVRELHLSNCVRLYEPDVELLKELVVDVFWDGVIEDEYSDDDEYSEEHLEYGGHGFFGPIYYPTSSYSQSDDDLIEPPNLGP